MIAGTTVVERLLARRGAVLAIGAWALVAALAALAEPPPAVRAPLTIPFLLVGPGLALTTLMGSMRLTARLVVAVLTSVAVLIVVSSLQAGLDLWSGPLVLLTLALLTQLIVVVRVLQQHDVVEPRRSPT